MPAPIGEFDSGPQDAPPAERPADEWCKDIAPSVELRKWYGHYPGRFEEFSRRYHAELKKPQRAEARAHLRELARDRPLTLLTAARQPEISEAALPGTAP